MVWEEYLSSHFLYCSGRGLWWGVGFVLSSRQRVSAELALSHRLGPTGRGEVLQRTHQ